jgi:hypothetical protein
VTFHVAWYLLLFHGDVHAKAISLTHVASYLGFHRDWISLEVPTRTRRALTDDVNTFFL